MRLYEETDKAILGNFGGTAFGDIALVPDPCYPAYVAGVKIAGAGVHRVPLLKQNGFLPDLEAIPATWRAGRA